MLIAQGAHHKTASRFAGATAFFLTLPFIAESQVGSGPL